MKHNHDFIPVRDARGTPGVIGTCHDCGVTETVRAPLGRSRGPGHKSGIANESISVALNKLTARGWTYVGKTLRCPACAEARRSTKVLEPKPASIAITPAIEEETTMENKTTSPKRLTALQLYTVIDMLKSMTTDGRLVPVTDPNADATHAYAPGWSDQKVAEACTRALVEDGLTPRYGVSHNTIAELRSQLGIRVRARPGRGKTKAMANTRERLAALESMDEVLAEALEALERRVQALEDLLGK